MRQTRDWYRITNAADGKAADLYVYDSIGKSWWDDQTVTAKQFVADLAALPESVETIRVHVNSPGGDVFDAVAIANALRNHKATVEMSIEGLAASAATIITSAGDTVRMARNSLLMIHNPHGFVMGPAGDMRKTADLLDKVRASIVATYQWRSKLGAEDLIALMDATTWMDGEQALANGFVTEIVDDVKAETVFRPAAIAHLGEVPEKHRPLVRALVRAEKPAVDPDEDTEKPKDDAIEPDEGGGCPDGYEKGDDGMCHLVGKAKASKPAAAALIARACREQGFPEMTEGLLGLPMATVTAKLEAAARAKAEREARATAIRGLCATAKLPELAEGYIAGEMPVASVQAHLTTVTAKLDRVEIDARVPPPGDARGGHGVTTESLWDDYRKSQLATKGA